MGIDTASIGNRIFLVQSMVIQDAYDKIRYQKTYSAQFDQTLLNILVYYNNTEELKKMKNFLNKLNGIDKVLI